MISKAFGDQSGMGATAGLCGAIAVGIFVALFGGTETQASGPTGLMTVVSASIVAFGIQMNGSLDNAMDIILLTFLLVLIPIGFKIIDFKGLKHLTKVPRADSVVLFLVLTVTTFGSLIHAVGIGIALACLLFMKKSGYIGEQGLEVEKIEESFAYLREYFQ
ncbi:MAG: SulP family inorganic anion transporter [Bacteroidota bacterium]